MNTICTWKINKYNLIFVPGVSNYNMMTFWFLVQAGILYTACVKAWTQIQV